MGKNKKQTSFFQRAVRCCGNFETKEFKSNFDNASLYAQFKHDVADALEIPDEAGGVSAYILQMLLAGCLKANDMRVKITIYTHGADDFEDTPDGSREVFCARNDRPVLSFPFYCEDFDVDGPQVLIGRNNNWADNYAKDVGGRLISLSSISMVPALWVEDTDQTYRQVMTF
jgi:hypothetical protein